MYITSLRCYLIYVANKHLLYQLFLCLFHSLIIAVAAVVAMVITEAVHPGATKKNVDGVIHKTKTITTSNIKKTCPLVQLLSKDVRV